MLLRSILALTLMTISAISYATFNQQIELCLSVQNSKIVNLPENSFSAQVDSSDLISGGAKIGGITEGIHCASHTFLFGPKNIKLKFGIESNNPGKIAFIPNKNCDYMHKVDTKNYSSDYLRTGGRHERWTIALLQHKPVQSYGYVYQMYCSHQTWN